jgi:hypothetical protein
MIVLITILLKMSKNEVMVRVKVFPNSNKTNVSSYVHNLVFSKLIACINQSKTHFVIFCKKWFSYFQTKLSKILSIKKQWIQELKEMNTRAEKQVCVCICSLKKKIIVH